MNKNSDQEIVDGKVFAILSYLSILCIIPLVLKKENRFVLFHGKQGLVVFIGEVAVFVVHIVLGPAILSIGNFVFGVISLVGIIQVLRGKFYKFPYISDIAEKITL